MYSTASQEKVSRNDDARSESLSAPSSQSLNPHEAIQCCKRLVFAKNHQHNRLQKPISLTGDSGSFWQDGDGTDCGVLEALNRAVLGSPAVRADPQEMAHFIGSFAGVKDPPVNIRTHESITVTPRPSATPQRSRRCGLAIVIASRLNRYRVRNTKKQFSTGLPE